MLSNEDKEYILGTYKKRIHNKFNDLKTNFTRENAEEYSHIYENESIKNIINNSECIFSEPYFGTDFYKEFVKTKNLPPYTYVTERDKLRDYLERVEDKIEDEQKNLYESVISLLNSKINDSKMLINLHQYMESSERDYNDRDLDESLLELYSAVDMKNESTEEIVDTFVSESHSIPVLVVTAIDCLLEYDENITNQVIKGLTLVNESADMTEPNWVDYESYIESVVTMASIKDVPSVKEKVRKITNPNLYKTIIESMNTSIKDLYNSCNVVKSDFRPSRLSTDYVVESLLLEEVYLNSPYEEEKRNENIATVALERATILDTVSNVLLSELSFEDNHDYTKTANSIVNEFIGESVSIEDSMEYFTNQYSDNFNTSCNYLEFTSNGEASKVIRNSAGTYREEIGSSKKSKDNKKEKEDDNDLDFDNEEENTSTKKPKKQKESLTQKIQNKGMDAEMKTQKIQNKISKGVRNIKNASKAVLAAPASIVRQIKTFIVDWEKASEDKKKELMLKPGYRSSLHKLFKTAIKFKMFFAIGKLLSIKIWIIKKILKFDDKKKTLRIRNELAAELDTEIKVCEEKINDANADQNQKEKYKLMRLRDKLVAERTRVRTNSKYI